LLDGVMEALSIPAGRRIEVFRSIDAFDRIGSTGVRDRLGAGRTDESGARTEGVGLDEVQIDGIFGLMFHTPALVPNVNDPENSDLQYSNARVLAHLQGFASASRTLEAGVEELTEIADLTASAGYRDDRIQRVSRSSSARSAGAGAMTGWSGASAGRTCRRPASPWASRGSRPR
jgi:histidyl-tRNA synthetase